MSETVKLTERDYLEMAYRHAMICFHGDGRSTAPAERAEEAVELAILGHGPRDIRALNAAKARRLNVRGS